MHRYEIQKLHIDLQIVIQKHRSSVCDGLFMGTVYVVLTLKKFNGYIFIVVHFPYFNLSVMIFCCCFVVIKLN